MLKKYVLFRCLRIRMHACLLKAKKILEVGVQGLKLNIYHITAYMITGKSRKSYLINKAKESYLLNKAKARKECNAPNPSKTQV